MTKATAAALIAACALGGCRRGPEPTAVAGDAEPAALASASASAAPAIAPPRCQPAGTGAAVASPEELEVGDALVRPGGYAVALVHRTAAGRVAAIGLASGDSTSLRIVDLGPTLGDAPPPHFAARGDGLLAAAYGLATHGDTRELRVYDVPTTGDAKLLGTIAEPRDDSLAFDVAPGLVVWDEATAGKSARGVVRGATVSADGHVGAPRDLSPADSDAEAPRVVGGAADGKGAFVLWTARRPEPTGPVDAAQPPESVGEVRAYGWLEMTVVDASGAPVGAARRLTPTSGHVTSFDVHALVAERKPAILVVARDLGEAVDGSGGALLRVRGREDGADPPLAFPTDGLGRGAPSFIEAPSPWLAWVDAHEALRLLPLDAAGAPSAPPSLEPALEDRSPLLELPATGTGGAHRVLVAAPTDASSQLQVFACGP